MERHPPKRVSERCQRDARKCDARDQSIIAYRGKTISLLVQDPGIGVNLKSADELFTPFVGKLELSRDREEIGYGGMGLGLTIVRMLAVNLGCKVAFIEPEPGFKTAFRLSWTSTEDRVA